MSFEVHISKYFAEMAIDWHKISQMPLLGKNVKWAYLGMRPHMSSIARMDP